MPAWSGLFDRIHGQPYTFTGSRGAVSREIELALKQPGNAVLGALMAALNGAAVGGTATRTVRQVEALRENAGYTLGGRRNVLTNTLINRATIAADKTAIDTIEDQFVHPQTSIIDRSRMGGGSKAGRL